MTLKEVDFKHNLAANVATMRRHGLLLTSVDAEGRPNVMTIGWANPGVIWTRPILVIFVRPSRFTYGNIEATMQFAVGVPSDDMAEACLHCGSASGRDHDKFADCGFSTTQAQTVAAPLIDQCVMHYECRVVHKNDVVPSQLDPAVCEECYPDGDFHRVYYGQILRTTVRVD